MALLRTGAAFVGGLAVMGAEMVFARQVAPWFGSSLPVWAVLISTLLLALALGAGWGGRRSLRNHQSPGRPTAAALLVVAGAGLLAAAWLVPVLLAAAGRGRVVGPPVAVMAAVAALVVEAAPLFLLGALAPTLLAEWVHDGAPAGWASGRLSAAATAGSLAGTLGAAFVALPLLGTRATGLALAGGCIGAGLLARGRTAGAGVTRSAAVLFVAVALSASAGRGPPPALALRPGERLVEARETPYQAAYVVERPDGSRSLRLSSLREWHSHYDPRGPALEGVWPAFLLAQALRPGCASPPGRTLVLGLGAGTLARDLQFAFPGTFVRGVEIDAEVVALGRKWFALPQATQVEVGDARRFLDRPVPPVAADLHDLVLLDAFSGAYLPFQLATRESFQGVAARLAPGGALAVNVLSFPEDAGLEQAVARTLAAVFQQVAVVRLRPGYNAVLFAWQGQDAGQSPSRACAEPAHAGQRAMVRRLQARVERLAPDPSQPVLTDDRAPVEWLTHRMAWAALVARPVGARQAGTR